MLPSNDENSLLVITEVFQPPMNVTAFVDIDQLTYIYEIDFDF